MIIADLHIHSKFSRACSKDIDINNLEKYARIKGVNLLGTGDFQHPKWFEEIKSNLSEDENGILWTKNKFPFILQTEISLMYKQDGKGRRVHHVVLAPNIDVVKQVIEALGKRGRLDYDGRPIFGISSIEFVEMLKEISDDIEIIPAHCLIPDSLMHTKNSVKKIKDIKKNDYVLTHNGRYEKVTKIYKREYSGEIIKIIPACLKIGTWFTPEHPIYSIRSHKKCKNAPHTICKPTCAYLKRKCKIKAYEKYKPEWTQVKYLYKGDIIIYPRPKKIKDVSFLDLSEILPYFYTEGDYIKPRKEKAFIKNILINKKIHISKEFCRLIGYYLSEGYLSKGCISFTFNKKEVNYIKDVKNLLLTVFGLSLKPKVIQEAGEGLSLIVHSKILEEFFKMFYESSPYRAYSKKIPFWMIDLPKDKLKQILIGWWRGDAGVTTSANLTNQFKLILLKLGIVPSIDFITAERVMENRKQNLNRITGRDIVAKHDCYSFRFLCFFDESNDLLVLPEFKKFKTKLNRRKGWIDKNYVYLPIIRIDKRNYEGEVFNLEINKDNSYLTENLAVHNCMTPWFGIFGSKTGFDSLKECFQEKSNKIYAVESGLSADPKMLWRFSWLEDKSIVSFSDMHSFWPWRMGREATIFDCELTYKNLIKAIRTGGGLNGTIEVNPAYGKYHIDGHRLCNIKLEPKETLKNKGICPVCGKPLTIGVLYRVEQLADRPEGFIKPNAPKYYSLIPLAELIASVYNTRVESKKALEIHDKLIHLFGNELDILLNAAEQKLKEVVDEKLVKIILLNREGKLKISPGYDGVYGKIILNEEEQIKI